MKRENIKPDLLQDETLGQKLIKKWFWLYLFALLMGPAGYIIRMLITNSGSVSVADIGVFYSIISLISFLNAYNDLGLTESLQYFLPRFWVKKQYNHIKTVVRLSLWAQMITALIMIAVLFFGADRLAANYFHSENAASILQYFCLYFLGINLFQTIQTIFNAFQKTFDYQFVEFVRLYTTVIFTAIFFFGWMQSIQWYAIAWLLGLAGGILVAIILYTKKYRKSLMQGTFKIDKPMLKEYKNYALWALLGISVWTIFWQLAQQMVVYLLWPEPAGYYSTFLSFFTIVSTIVLPIMGLIFPMVSEIVTKEQKEKLHGLSSFFYTYFSVFSLLILVILMVLWPEIALILFGERFVLSGELFTVGALFNIFIVLANFNFNVLAGMGKIKERVKIMAWSLLFLFAWWFIGIKIGWLYGMVIAYSLAYFLLRLLSHLLIKKDVKTTIQRNFVGKNVVLLLCLWIALWGVKSHVFVFDDAERYRNLLKLIILWVVYCCIFLWFNYKRLLLLRKEVKRLKG